MAIRKSVRNLSPDELAKLRYGFSLMMNIRDQRGYMFLAGIHNITQNKCKHGETETAWDPNFRLFLPWHRAYLYWFEKYLQDSLHDPTTTVPWWDWTSNESRNEGIPRAFSDDTVNGLSNPLYTFHVELPDWVNLGRHPPAGAPLRVGIGGPGRHGKTELVAGLCRGLRRRAVSWPS